MASWTSRPNRVAITGIGILAPNGIGLKDFWETLTAGISGIARITRFDASDLPCQIAGEVKGFEPEMFIDPTLKPRKRMGLFTQYGMAAAKMATEDAGLTRADLSKLEDLPVVMGVSTGSEELRAKKPQLFTAVAGVPGAAASAIGYQYNPKPRLMTISDGCASSLDAVAMAASMIRLGETDIALAGGAESSIERYLVEIMLKCRRCSTRNDNPQLASCPFDARRDYGVMAEGAGIVVLENMDHALARGVRLYGEIRGYAACGDPVNAEEGGGLAVTMRRTLQNAGMRPSDVDHVSAHGPSDIDMDRTETEVIKTALGEAAYRVAVSSIKGVTGCPMGAGGVMQLIAACLTLEKSVIPPTANYERPDPKCDLDYVPRARPVDVRTILINTHGFGRHNGSMLLHRVERP
jgi:3-oxoacyl-[acyl-carrier-protein] synthase II